MRGWTRYDVPDSPLERIVMSFKSEQGKLQKHWYSKESAGKILGAAAHQKGK